jgi:hypothetical protein
MKIAVVRPAITVRELPTALLDEREDWKGLAPGAKKLPGVSATWVEVNNVLRRHVSESTKV